MSSRTRQALLPSFPPPPLILQLLFASPSSARFRSFLSRYFLRFFFLHAITSLHSFRPLVLSFFFPLLLLLLLSSSAPLLWELGRLLEPLTAGLFVRTSRAGEAAGAAQVISRPEHRRGSRQGRGAGGPAALRGRPGGGGAAADAIPSCDVLF